MKKIFLLICFVFFNNSANDGESQPDQLKIGNLALPTSQVLKPLFSFGQNVIDKNDILAWVTETHKKAKHLRIDRTSLNFLYGINDKCSFLLHIPFANSQICNLKSSGVEDIRAQFEYAYYVKNTLTASHQATIVTNLTLPNGSIKKNPPLGFGSPSIFLGGTYRYLAIDWYFFTSDGVIITTPHNKTKFGNTYLYEVGFGKNIGNPGGWILTWFIEMNGSYQQKNKIDGIIDPNSGGNTIFLGPCLWLSSKKLIVQFGIQFPVLQRLNGIQPKGKYITGVSLTWKF